MSAAVIPLCDIRIRPLPGFGSFLFLRSNALHFSLQYLTFLRAFLLNLLTVLADTGTGTRVPDASDPPTMLTPNLSISASTSSEEWSGRGIGGAGGAGRPGAACTGGGGVPLPSVLLDKDPKRSADC